MFVPPRLNSLAALTLLSVSPLVEAIGQAIVVNECSFPAYLWSVSNSQSPMQTLSPNGGTYSEAYQINPAGGGVSLKISDQPTLASPIIQFEYTNLDLLWYDLSKVDGSPFGTRDLSLIPSDPSCQAVYCSPDGHCGGSENVFYEPYDNNAVSACSTESDLVFTLCSSSSGGRPPKGPSPPPAPAPPAPPAPSSAAPVPTTYPALAPSPAPTPAPAPPAVGTTFITQYVTVETTVNQIVTVTAK